MRPRQNNLNCRCYPSVWSWSQAWMSASLVCRLAKVQPVSRMKRRIRREPGQLQESSGEGPHNLPGPAGPIRHVVPGRAGRCSRQLAAGQLHCRDLCRRDARHRTSRSPRRGMMPRRRARRRIPSRNQPRDRKGRFTLVNVPSKAYRARQKIRQLRQKRPFRRSPL